MKISKPTITQDGDLARYECSVDSRAGVSFLWYTVPRAHTALISEKSDAALAALILPAMFFGEDIQIEGAISSRLYYNLNGRFQSLMRHLRPSLRIAAITPSELLDDRNTASGCATGFSGGIDSFCAIADHHHYPGTPGFRLTHLLFNNVGSHGIGAEKLFFERFAQLKPAADRMNLPFIPVNSNVDAFYDEPAGLDFVRTHTFRNASVALLLQRGIARFLYASAFDYSRTKVHAHQDCAYGDALTLPLLSTANLDAFSVGGEYTRVQKTIRVAGLPEARTSLNVCVDGRTASNCSACFKCLRTLLTLEIAGLLPEFRQLFNLDIYQRHRAAYIANVLSTQHDPFSREIVDLMRERAFTPPAGPRAVAAVKRSARAVGFNAFATWCGWKVRGLKARVRRLSGSAA